VIPREACPWPSRLPPVDQVEAFAVGLRAVAGEGDEVPGYVTIPHTASGNYLVGGPSNAGAPVRSEISEGSASHARSGPTATLSGLVLASRGVARD